MDFILSLLMHAIFAFVKVFAKAIAYYIIKCVKDRIALSATKDDSDTTN